MPPEPPKNRHKRLLASSLLLTISVSLLSGLAVFNVSMMAGQTSALAMPSVVLSVSSLADGPKFIQNVTYQCINETYQSVQDTAFDTLWFSCTSGHSDGDSGYSTANIINNGEKNFTIAIIEIYRGDCPFALIEGPFTVSEHSEGVLKFQVYNLRELAKNEVEWLTGKEADFAWVQYWRPVLYNAVIRTTEGVTFTDFSFIFPSAPGPVNA